jgi:hypothetical protein
VKLSGEYKNSLAAVNLESEFKSLNPVISAAGVLGYNGKIRTVQSSFSWRSKIAVSVSK